MKLLHAKRLLKLARHLEVGKLGHDGFHFSTYRGSNSCGTVGCALGECPTVFKQWKWDRSRLAPLLKRDLSRLTDNGAMKFFGLIRTEVHHLFYPTSCRADSTCPLPGNATKEEVAAHIRKFVINKLGVVRPKKAQNKKNLETCTMCSGLGKVEITQSLTRV